MIKPWLYIRWLHGINNNFVSETVRGLSMFVHMSHCYISRLWELIKSINCSAGKYMFSTERDISDDFKNCLFLIFPNMLLLLYVMLHQYIWNLCMSEHFFKAQFFLNIFYTLNEHINLFSDESFELAGTYVQQNIKAWAI